MDPAQLHHLLNDERYKYTMPCVAHNFDPQTRSCVYCGIPERETRMREGFAPHQTNPYHRHPTPQELGLPNNPYINSEAIPVGVEVTTGNVVFKNQEGKMVFDSGAHRSNDKAGVAWHLIHPTVLQRLEIIFSYSADRHDSVSDELAHCLYWLYYTLTVTNEDELYKAINMTVRKLFYVVQTIGEGDEPYSSPIDRSGITEIPIIPLQKIAEAYAEGAKKYGVFNCEKGFPIGDLINHAIAHIMAFMSGRDTDEDDLGHACWNVAQVLFMNEYYWLVKDHQLRPDHPINKRDYGQVGSRQVRGYNPTGEVQKDS